MYYILKSKKYENDYEKSKHYLQVLRRYLIFKENERNNSFITYTDNALTHEHVREEDNSLMENVIKNPTHSTPRLKQRHDSILNSVSYRVKISSGVLLAHANVLTK